MSKDTRELEELRDGYLDCAESVDEMIILIKKVDNGEVDKDKGTSELTVIIGRFMIKLMELEVLRDKL